jgi:hypothetical protein
VGDFDASNFTGLVLPAMCLAALGWTVPRVIAMWWPEGVKWLMGLALVSTFVMALFGAAFFAVLYAMQGISLSELFETQGLGAIAHFAGLSLLSALMWAPLMVLSLIGVPKNWVREVW